MTTTELTAGAVVEEARLAERSGAIERALGLYQSALATLPDPSPTRADVLRWMGTIHRERGDQEKALGLYAQSLTQADACAYGAGRAHALNCQAIVAQTRGRPDEAQELFARAAADAAAVGEHRLLGMIEQNLGVAHNMRGELERALLRYRMSLRAFEEAKDDEAESWVLNNLGMLHQQRRDLGDAQAAYRRAMAIAERRGDSWMMLMLETNYASLLVDLGELRQAEALCQRVLAVAAARADVVREADALRCRARVLGARSRLKDARADLERALGLAERTEDTLLVAQVLADLGGVHGRLGAADAAEFAWRRALDLFTRIGAAREAREVAAHLDRPPTAPRLVVA